MSLRLPFWPVHIGASLLAVAAGYATNYGLFVAGAYALGWNVVGVAFFFYIFAMAVAVFVYSAVVSAATGVPFQAIKWFAAIGVFLTPVMILLLGVLLEVFVVGQLYFWPTVLPLLGFAIAITGYYAPWRPRQ